MYLKPSSCGDAKLLQTQKRGKSKFSIALHLHKVAAGYWRVQPTETAEVATVLAEKILSLIITNFCSTVGSNTLMGHIIFVARRARYWEDLPYHMPILIPFQDDPLLRGKNKELCLGEKKQYALQLKSRLAFEVSLFVFITILSPLRESALQHTEHCLIQ